MYDTLIFFIGTINTDMDLSLSDILTILGGIGALVGVYVALKKSIIESKSLINQHHNQIAEQKKEIQALTASLQTERDTRNVDNKELWTKLVAIESSQSRTNIFLEENLKSINRLLEIHDAQIKGFQTKFETQDKNISEFFQTYDLKKKE